MMGRSHALLGAIGYAALEPLAKLDLPVDRGVLTVIWGVAFIGIVAMPAKRGSKGDKFNIGHLIYRGAYWVIQIAVVLGAIVLASQWLYVLYPDLFPTSPIERFNWMVVATGFALLPDIDEPASTVSRLFGPISRVISTATRELAGGHRKATHSWIMPLIGVGLVVCSQYNTIIAGIVMSISYILAVRMVVPDKATGAAWIVMVIGLLSAWMAALGNLNLTPMLLAVPAGILLHDLGDWFTNTGIPFLWPHKKKYAAKFFYTGGDTEVYFVRPLMFTVLMIMIVLWIIIPMGEWSETAEFSNMFKDLPSISTVSGS